MHHELLVDQYNWILIYLVVGWEGNVLANELKTTFIIFFMWRPHKNPGFKTEICAPMYNILAICICIIMCVYIYSKICLKRFKPIWQLVEENQHFLIIDLIVQGALATLPAYEKFSRTLRH